MPKPALLGLFLPTTCTHDCPTRLRCCLLAIHLVGGHGNASWPSQLPTWELLRTGGALAAASLPASYAWPRYASKDSSSQQHSKAVRVRRPRWKWAPRAGNSNGLKIVLRSKPVVLTQPLSKVLDLIVLLVEHFPGGCSFVGVCGYVSN